MEERKVTINPGEELRLEVTSATGILLTLLQGTADLFGSPLQLNTVYEFPAGSRFALYTPKANPSMPAPGVNEIVGAHISLRGAATTQQAYSFVSYYSDLLDYLSASRVEAMRSGARGPRVLVCGPTECGKNTLCRILANAAIKNDHSVVLVDLDVANNSLAIPGAISAVFLDEFTTVDDGFTNAMPLTYYYGETVLPSTSLPSIGSEVSGHKFLHMCQCMQKVICENMDARATLSDGGALVNTAGYDSSATVEQKDAFITFLLHVVGIFDINMVCVLGDTPFAAQLNSRAATAPLKTAFVVRECQGAFGLTPSRREGFMRVRSAHRIREYFYGIRTKLQCYRVTVPLKSVQLITLATDSLEVHAVEVGNGRWQRYVYAVAAVSNARTLSDVSQRNVAGFVVILNVNEVAGHIDLIAPAPNSLPGKYLLVSSSVRMLPDDALGAK